LNLTSVQVVGRENALPGQAYVILANHRSHFDIPAFYGHWPRQFRWVMKAELRRVPFLGWATAVLGNLFIDRHDRGRAMAQLRAAQSLLAQGISVMLFPEGTRSTSGRMLDFRKGGFVLAVDAGLPILPVSISGSHPILPPHHRTPRPGRIRITVHPPIRTTGLGPQDIGTLTDRVREVIASGLEAHEV
jgi:1-acyl-sn-glycerol-3-phosphate acyltransferase